VLSSESNITNWTPQLTEFLAIMRTARPWSVEMSRYSRGADNKHIDVHLSPTFMTCVKNLVNGMIQKDLDIHYWGKANKAAFTEEIERFRVTYDNLMEMSIQEHDLAPSVLEPIDWMRLAQLSVFKYLIQSVALELEELRHSLEKARAEEQKSGKHLQYHQQLTILARESGSISYRVSKQIFTIVERLEGVRLRRLRKSLLGMSWPIPQESLFNVLLRLPNLLNEEMAVYHYPMLCLGSLGKQNRIKINACIIEVFKDYLPTWLSDNLKIKNVTERITTDLDDAEDSGIPLRIIDRKDQGNLQGFLESEIVLNQLLTENEYKTPLYTWLDDPSNLLRLFGLSITQNPDKTPIVPEISTEDAIKRWRNFMRGIREELFKRLYDMNIVTEVVASYWTTRIYQTLPPNTSPRLIYEYLTGHQDRQKILRRFNAHQNPELANIAKTLDSAVAEIRQMSRNEQRKYLGRVMIDFLTLRKDLKLAYKTFEAMDQISVLTNEKKLALSRANGLLHEFLLTQEQTGDQRIRCHAVLKADLRGSTKVTTELRAKKLNPATHFSQNFFNPITASLEHFGANKVFVEGDAVILSILEKTGDSKSGRTVACACGLGAEILDIVARHNITNRRYGLPELELGIGITFVNEEPTYLYDGDRTIMISSAINLADRLSSCAKVLRNAPFTKTGRPFRVEVLVPPEGSDATAGAKTNVLRYNVNGIEMDAMAFAKLKTEIALRPLYLKVGGQIESLHVGQYPDRSDRRHLIVVRESPVHIWEWGEISTKTDPENQIFYEVVVDEDLINKVRNKLNPRRDSQISDSRFPTIDSTTPEGVDGRTGSV